MAYNGASLGGVIFSPLWIALIAGIGFVPATLAIGAVMVVAVLVLSVLVFRHTPESLGQNPDGGPDRRAQAAQAAAPLRRSFLRDRKFLTLAAGMMLGLFAQIGLLAHLFSLLVPVLGEGLTGLAMGGATAAAILGRTLVGRMMPATADRRLVACASYGVQVVGSLLFIVAAGDAGRVTLALGFDGKARPCPTGGTSAAPIFAFFAAPALVGWRRRPPSNATVLANI